MFIVLTSVEHIEAAHPERHCCSEDENARVKAPADSYPCGRRSESKRKTEHNVRPAGNALRVAVTEQNDQDKRAELKCEPIEIGRGYHEENSRQHCESEHEGA